MVKTSALLGLSVAGFAWLGTPLYGQQLARQPRPPVRSPAATALATSRPAPARPEIALGKPRAAMQRTRLQVEVYELKLEGQTLPEIDTAQLAEGTRANVLARLGEIGEGHLVHMVDVPLLLDASFEASIRLGSSVPILREVAVTAKGTVTPSVDYEDIGLRVNLRGAWIETAAGPAVEAILAVQWSGLGTSTVALSKDIKLPVFTQFKFEQLIKATSNQPLLFLARQPSTPRDDAEGVMAGMVRITMTQLLP